MAGAVFRYLFTRAVSHPF